MNRLYICAIALLAALASLCRLLSTQPGSPWSLLAMMIAVAAYLGAIHFVGNLEWKHTRWLIVGVAVAGRVILLPSPFVLSDDVYRYHWEGKIQVSGFNPYVHPPAAPELEPLRDEVWKSVAHAQVPSIYPPLMQQTFHLGALTGLGPRVFKLFFAAFDLAAIWLIVQMIRLRGRDPSAVLVWAWSPLVIIEFAGMAHGMSMAVTFFLAGLWLLEGTPGNGACPSSTGSTSCTTKHLTGAGVAFAASVLSHYFAGPLVMAVVCCRRLTNWKFWTAFLVPMALFFAMYADAGANIVTGFLHFSAQWRFNGSLFEIMAWLTGEPVPTREIAGVHVVYPAIKLISAATLVSVMALVAWQRSDTVRAAGWTAATVLLLSPTVHPWYVTWMAALGCVWFRWSWIVFSGLVMLSYAAKLAEWQTGFWQETTWTRWTAYTVLFGLIFWESLRKQFDSSRRHR